MKTERIKVSPDGDLQGFRGRAVPCTGETAGRNNRKSYRSLRCKIKNKKNNFSAKPQARYIILQVLKLLTVPLVRIQKDVKKRWN